MHHHTGPDGTLIVTATSGFFDWLLLGSAALCTVPTMREALQGSFAFDHATPLAGTAFFLFGFLVSFERARFEFDPRLRVIRWVRRRAWSRREGTLPFSLVQSVILQTSLGGSATCPSVRIAVISDRGELPLTTAYAGGMQDEYEALVAKIRELLKLSPSSADIFMDSVRSAIAQGRTIDAIRLVRLKQGLSLTDATRFVAQLPRPPASSS